MRNTSFPSFFVNASRCRGQVELELELELEGPGAGAAADTGGSGGGGGVLKENSCRCVQSQGPMAY
jgi:hypothetical protein